MIICFLLIIKFIFILTKDIYDDNKIKNNIINITSEIIAIGDLHGNVKNTLKILKKAEVIDPIYGKWNGGNKILVQVGDLFDRGSNPKLLVDFFIQLQKEAEQDGGKVINLLGNHELLQITGDHRYVHHEDPIHFGGWNKRKEILSSHGYIGQWIRNNPVTVKLNQKNSSSIVFVHAGILPEFAKYGIDKLNVMAQKAFEKNDFDNILFSEKGPLWNRDLFYDAQSGSCSLVKKALRYLKANQMVVGHTTESNRTIGRYCNDTLFNIDVGINQNSNDGKNDLAFIKFVPNYQEHISNNTIIINFKYNNDKIIFNTNASYRNYQNIIIIHILIILFCQLIIIM